MRDMNNQKHVQPQKPTDMKPEEIKTMKAAQTVLTYINLFLSMIYVMAVDSLDMFDLVTYALVLGGLWYVVKMMNDRIEEEKSK